MSMSMSRATNTLTAPSFDDAASVTTMDESMVSANFVEQQYDPCSPEAARLRRKQRELEEQEMKDAGLSPRGMGGPGAAAGARGGGGPPKVMPDLRRVRGDAGRGWGAEVAGAVLLNARWSGMSASIALPPPNAQCSVTGSMSSTPPPPPGRALLEGEGGHRGSPRAVAERSQGV